MTKKSKKEKKIDPKDKIKELTETLQRVQADFENYKKRVETEKQEFIKYANHKLIEKLLTIIDSFEIALKNQEKVEEFTKGIDLIYANIINLLKSEGVKPITVKPGDKLNPRIHEVLLSEKSNKQEDTILEELQKGYMLSDCVLRTSKVKVSKK